MFLYINFLLNSCHYSPFLIFNDLDLFQSSRFDIWLNDKSFSLRFFNFFLHFFFFNFVIYSLLFISYLLHMSANEASWLFRILAGVSIRVEVIILFWDNIVKRLFFLLQYLFLFFLIAFLFLFIHRSFTLLNHLGLLLCLTIGPGCEWSSAVFVNGILWCFS